MRLLEDHRDVAAAELPQRLDGQLREIDHRAFAGPEQDLAADDASGRIRNQPHDRQARHRLAGAGFADDGERFPGVQRERDVLDRLDQPGIGEEMGPQMPDLQQRSASVRLRGHAHIAFRSLGSSRSRKPSPTICSDSAERMIATPGNTTSQIA